MEPSGIQIDMVITDLDGTLLNGERQVSRSDYDALRSLGYQNIVRVIATGRSYYSLKKVLPPDFPIDFLLFSSGAGIMDWSTKTIMKSEDLKAHDVQRIARILITLKLDFMIQKTIPDNHHFLYHYSGVSANPDFFKRIDLYRPFAESMDSKLDSCGDACQFVIICPPRSNRYDKVHNLFKKESVIRTTSPLDHESIWIEIFPKQVSKSHAGQWLCDTLGIDNRRVLSIGNDYNDVDLLKWSGHAVVVENAPVELKNQFQVVSSHNEEGFSDAITQFDLLGSGGK